MIYLFGLLKGASQRFDKQRFFGFEMSVEAAMREAGRMHKFDYAQPALRSVFLRALRSRALLVSRAFRLCAFGCNPSSLPFN